MRKPLPSPAKVAQSVRTLRTGMFVFACTLLIAVVGLSGNVRRVDAAAGQYLKISVPDSPNATFYAGRCFKTNFRAQTDNLNANSVDIVIPYNPAYLQPYTDSGCTSVATSILTNSQLFPSYPGNDIAGNEILVTGYDPSGSDPVNTGAAPADQIVGYVFWKVMQAGSYTLAYDYTPGLTTDTNMVEDDGDGSDVLEGVENMALTLRNDINRPRFTSLSPANGLTNVSVTSSLTYVWSDTGAGINQNSRKFKLNGVSYTPTVSSCTTGNSNTKPQCNATVNPGTLSYATIYTATATGGDLAVVTNTGAQTWTFTTEDDDDAPYIDNLNPVNGATGVAVSSNIVFNVKDYKNNGGAVAGLGVDSSSIVVTVTVGGDAPIVYTSGPQMTIGGILPNRTVTINPVSNFPENTVVQVSIEASDMHSPPNVMSTYSYSFTTVDSQAPQFSGFSPAQSAASISADSNISFTVSDVGGGVDINNTTVTVEGVAYTQASPQFSYSGTPASYTITINPSSNFTGGQVVDVSISTRDLASPTPNTATSSYNFTIANSCTTCSVTTENPARFTTSAALDETVSFHVLDTGAGIDSDTIRVVLIGTGSAFTINPLVLTGSSPLVSITGTSADYTVVITLPAAIVEDIPYGITIDASDSNGLDMSQVAYTFINLSGGGASSSASSCPVCTQTACTTSAPDVEPDNGGRRGETPPPYDYPDTSAWPEIVRRWILSDGEVRERALSSAEARQINRCYIDGSHEAAPRTPYGDVEPGAWYEDALERLLKINALDAGQESFRPGHPAVRAEFATMLVRMRSTEKYATPASPSFDDTDAVAWYHPFVEEGARNRWVMGYNDCYGTRPCFFKPLNTATRAEAAAMVVRAFSLKPLESSPVFADVSPDAWYSDELAIAADYCLMQGDGQSDNAVPDRTVNRAEMAVMMDRAYQNLRYGRDCGLKSAATGGMGASLLGTAGAGMLSTFGGLVLIAGVVLAGIRRKA